MDAITMIKGRRSVRKFKDEDVDRELMKKIIETSRFSPSWANFQVARYTLVDDLATIKKIADEGVNDFVYNMDTLKNAKGVLVLSYVKGKSGKIEDLGYDSNTNAWEIFDAGIACQTFCLAAHANGIGTTIMGIINDETISKIVNLPEEESVAVLIVYGYPDENPAATSRMDVEDIMRFAGE